MQKKKQGPEGGREREREREDRRETDNTQVLLHLFKLCRYEYHLGSGKQPQTLTKIHHALNLDTR